jgi:hypothetical protein
MFDPNNEVEPGDSVKITFQDGTEFRGVVQQACGAVVWISGGDVYWRDSGQQIGFNTSRLEHAPLDELERLLDVSVLS